MEANLNKQDKAIAEAVDRVGESDDLIRLSTGVILRAKQANPNVLIRIMTASPRPQPPTYFNEAMGREMENPDHPDYLKRVSAWEMEYNNGMLNALVGLGTEIYSIPKGMEGPHPKIKAIVICDSCKTKNKSLESSSCVKCGAPLPEVKEDVLGWIEDYKALGLPVNVKSDAWRYITWVLFKAAVIDTDTKLIGDRVKGLSGVKEADVRNAETFLDGDEEDRGSSGNGHKN